MLYNFFSVVVLNELDFIGLYGLFRQLSSMNLLSISLLDSIYFFCPLVYTAMLISVILFRIFFLWIFSCFLKRKRKAFCGSRVSVYVSVCDVVLTPKPLDRLFKFSHLKLALNTVGKIQFSL
jgi:hypothetical protein